MDGMRIDRIHVTVLMGLHFLHKRIHFRDGENKMSIKIRTENKRDFNLMGLLNYLQNNNNRINIELIFHLILVIVGNQWLKLMMISN